MNEAVRGPYPLVCRSDDGEAPRLEGWVVRYGDRAEIDSPLEGHFIEHFERGAFTKTLAERGDQIQVLFNHGRDPMIGKKPITLQPQIEDRDEGLWFSAEILDAAYVRDHLLPGLEGGVYGTSFRFKPVKENTKRYGTKSADNPDGLEERSVTEAYLREFGPVTFPSYKNSKLAVRSLTDEYLSRDEQQEQSDERIQTLEGRCDALEARLRALDGEEEEKGESQRADGHSESGDGESSSATVRRAVVSHSGYLQTPKEARRRSGVLG